jgi:AbrB family looped-hinge helix DNA binding protein
MKTIVSDNGQITLPSTLRRKDHIRAGQQFEIQRLKAGEYLLKQKPESSLSANNEKLVDWLLACPEKGWFQPMESESTDTLFREDLFSELEVPQPCRKKSRKAKTKT